MTPVKFAIQNEEFWLSPGRMIWHPADKALIIADLHFGKTGHFRKSGIPVPQNVFKEDLHQLFSGIQFYKPEKLLIVGDMFHSKANRELDLFLKWRNDISQLHIHLIKGNHDILNDQYYTDAGIQVDAQLNKGCFSFVHDINDIAADENDDQFYFSGHVHPGISISGGSRQTLHFPCFYFTKQYAVLPAFSVFSGHCMIRPKRGEHVFAIVNNSIVQIQ
ncbi:MAG: ligase-associated DNA damage response endonuclease PdeM [Panacibacter sp.]